MKKIKLSIRSTYLKLLLMIITILYPVRYYILYLDKENYSLKKHFFVQYKSFSFDRLPHMFILFWIIILIILSLFFPKEVELKKETPFYKIFKLYFIFQSLAFLFLYTILDLKWGGEVSFGAKILVVILESILGKDFIYILVLYNQKIRNKKIGWVIFLYCVPFFLGGSKSGIIFALFYLLALKLALKEKILTIKRIIMIAILYTIYPIIYYISWMIRAGKIQAIPYNEIKLLDPLKMLSHRVNGLDIFMAEYDKILNIKLLSSYENTLYFFKGFFGNGFVGMFSKNIKGYGRVFAEQVFQQPDDLISAYESTMIGTVYYSENRIVFGIILTVLLIMTIKILMRLFKNQGFVLIYFIVQIILFVMTGLLIKIGLTCRFILIYIILLRLFKFIKLNLLIKYKK